MNPFLHHIYYSGGNSSSGVQPEFENLIAYWPMNHDTYAWDVAGGHNGLVTGADVAEGGLSFNGTTDYVEILDEDIFSFGDGTTDSPFTWIMRYTPTNVSTQRWLVSKRGSTTQMEYHIAVTQTTRKVRMSLFNNLANTAHITAESDSTLTTGVLNFIVVTYDGSKTVGGIKMYINGVASTTTDVSSGTYGTGLRNGTSVLRLGNQSWAASSSGAIGTLGHVAVFNTALSQETITAIYNGGDILDYAYDAEEATLDIVEVSRNVFATRGDYQFSTDGTDLYWSNDRGETWINQYEWGNQFVGGEPARDKYINMAHIFADGTVIFACSNLLFRSTDQLQTVNAIEALDTDGVTPYPIHTPADATYPGAYFQVFSYDLRHHAEDIFVWASYSNVSPYGASAVNVWYTVDQGATIKPAYEFGVHPSFKDDGTADGGSTGTELGDSSNTRRAKHVHGVMRNPGTNDWYVVTGDDDNDCHCIKLTYDFNNDVWAPTEIYVNADKETRLKVGTCHLKDGYFYWGSESDLDDEERGIFRCLIGDIGTIEASEKLVTTDPPGKIVYLYVTDDNRIIFSFAITEDANQNAKIYVANDLGEGLLIAQPIAGMGASNKPGWYNPPDSQGYMKINVGRVFDNITKTIFIKV